MATLIDNIYIKTSKEIKLTSGIILNNISDHLPVFLFSEKYKSMKTEPLIFEHRKFNNNTYQQICEALSKTDWSSLNSSDAETCYNIIIDKINDAIEYFAPKKITKIPAKHTRTMDNPRNPIFIKTLR